MLSSPVVNRLESGSVEPDIGRARKRRHHSGTEDEIIFHIFKARHSYLSNNLESSAFDLGIAFHYIADGLCPSADDSRRHAAWERAISSIKSPYVLLVFSIIVSPEELLNKSFCHDARSPEHSLESSIDLCYSVLELTWRPKDDMLPIEHELIDKTKLLKPDMRAYELYCLSYLLLWPISLLVGYGLGVLTRNNFIFLIGFIGTIALFAYLDTYLKDKYFNQKLRLDKKCKRILQWYNFKG